MGNTLLLPDDLQDSLQQQFDRLSEIEKQIILFLAKQTGAIDLAKIL